MSWISGELVLIVTGVLFAIGAALGGKPGAAHHGTTRVTYLAVAMTSLAAGLYVARSDVTTPPWFGLVALIPLTLLAIVLRDRSRAARDHALTAPAAARPREASAPSQGAALRDLHRGQCTCAPTRHASVTDPVARAADPTTPAGELATIAFVCPQARVAIAGNPATPANLLEWLVAVGDEAVVASVAQRAHAAP
ncbi:hypothetical protein [Demequina globuliformis]|uniref:variant leucine-rich repeat-containing protein n=1 Tax=Demequina globuliformis TaxID=676202 RepID=UPI0007849A61|nr:hypothetical protein [Demequina globuliformis]